MVRAPPRPRRAPRAARRAARRALTRTPARARSHIQADGIKWRLGDIDNTGTMMILALKAIAVAVCRADGVRAAAGADGKAAGGGGRRAAALAAIAEGQRRRALREMPGPLAYLGYMFNCGSCLVGPYNEIRDYLDWAEGAGAWDERGGGYDAAARAGRWRAAGAALLKLSACVSLHLLIDARVRPDTVNATDTGAPGKLLLAHLVCVSARMRFYFVWILGELGGILSGLGYAGGGRWDRLRNQDILGIELCTSCAMLPIGWNIQVSTWLRRYAYERYLQHGASADAAVVLTQLVSAVWHGVYPGYLIFFLSSAICIQLSKRIHKRTVRLEGTRVYAWAVRPLLFLLTQIHNSCAGFSFVVLLWRDSIEFFRSVYFLNFALMAATLAVDLALPRPRAGGAGKPKES